MVVTSTGAGSSTSPEGAGGWSRHDERPRQHTRRFPLTLVLVLLATVVVAVVRPLALETFGIVSGSMVPSLRAGDRVLVDRLTYDPADVRRGDVIAFDDPERPGEVVIKRVVALPGDTVSIRAGTLLVNGNRQAEPYLVARSTGDFYGPTIVASGHLFVLGDNRSRSVDSRFFGAIPGGDLVGRVVARVWPPGRIAIL